MSLYKSSLALLKISIDGTTFPTIAGLKKHELHIRQELENANHIGGSRWRALASEAGSQHASIIAEGIFSDSTAEQLLLTRMLSGTVTLFQLALPNGDALEGEFLIAEYSRIQEINGEEAFAIRLESAGALTYS